MTRPAPEWMEATLTQFERQPDGTFKAILHMHSDYEVEAYRKDGGTVAFRYRPIWSDADHAFWAEVERQSARMVA